ncbi:TraR/DksA family transcriptional regulator [Galbitalea soli]|uniref:Zinc finger DksA/TraR C4-type domain-containing protein n=1 Tax=Galbitalea soli TaxID=1268042 RepID=A0A7C9PLP3_9MICO|nr:TraR/DksA family transcriptional regulator [Galbitalea soli]NEM90393.1 hypothetical protein [Galbitalea soli]NYJ31104.1 RNA polymerase-binding transcription factor DksA [Galbitalea soli]
MTGIAERATTTTSLTARQLTALRVHLVSDRERTDGVITQLIGEMDAFVSARRDTSTDDEHDPEGPTLAFERSQSEAMLSQARQHLRDIDGALLRMDEGRYGRCTSCTGEIALGRLQARPQSPLCISCAGRLR